MAIKYDSETKNLRSNGRVGFTDSTKDYVNRTTTDLRNAPRIQGALGPVESAYNPTLIMATKAPCRPTTSPIVRSSRCRLRTLQRHSKGLVECAAM
jgi:hypothetical protein